MIRCILVMKAEATVVVLVEQPKAAPVQGDNISRVYKNVILGGGKEGSKEGCPDKRALINLYYAFIHDLKKIDSDSSGWINT